jgi:hypothetical protein
MSFVISDHLPFWLFVRVSICPSAWDTWTPTELVFMKFDIWVFFENLVEKIPLSLNSDMNNGYFDKYACIYDYIYIYIYIYIFLSTTKEMQRYTVFFIFVSALHVSSGFSAHHQELKNCMCSIGTCKTWVLLSLAWFRARPGWNCGSILALLDSCLQSCMTYTIAKCTVSKLLMMGRGTARNM